MNVIVRTETWNTRKGEVVKAVVRTESGRILGATNQTASVSPLVTGRK
jgi:hypothetical protein